jgi:hypothetical protein
MHDQSNNIAKYACQERQLELADKILNRSVIDHYYYYEHAVRDSESPNAECDEDCLLFALPVQESLPPGRHRQVAIDVDICVATSNCLKLD